MHLIFKNDMLHNISCNMNIKDIFIGLLYSYTVFTLDICFGRSLEAQLKLLEQIWTEHPKAT